jgi:hypothetical protein
MTKLPEAVLYSKPGYFKREKRQRYAPFDRYGDLG